MYIPLQWRSTIFLRPVPRLVREIPCKRGIALDLQESDQIQLSISPQMRQMRICPGFKGTDSFKPYLCIG